MNQKNKKLFYEWVDFVTHPFHLQNVQTLKQRLDISNAISVNDKRHLEAIEEGKGSIVTKDAVVWDDDEFEAMEITEAGAVTIWTKKRVWTLHRDRGLEKLFYLPRHPNLE